MFTGTTVHERLHQGSIIINGSPVDIAKHWLDSTNIVMFNGKNIRPLLKSMCITDEHCMFKFLKLKLSNTIDYKGHKFPLIIFWLSMFMVPDGSSRPFNR